MGIAEDILLLEEKLNTLVRLYEQYFLGLEKRAPLKLLAEVEKIARKHIPANIVNTMLRFKYNSLVSRLQSYRQYWNRINREIEEGRYSRDRFKMGIHQPGNSSAPLPPLPVFDSSIDSACLRYLEARKSCNLSTDTIDPENLRATLMQQRKALEQKHNCPSIEFVVVIEEGKPKIKARPAR